MYNPDFVVCEVRPQLKIILDYAQSYNLLVSEHTAVDCSFLELAPTLYREATNRITLHALCDPSPSSKKQPRSGTPPAVFCAGPAVIDINVSKLLIVFFYLIICILLLFFRFKRHKSTRLSIK